MILSLLELNIRNLISQNQGDVGSEGVCGEEGHVLIRVEDGVVLCLFERSHELSLDLRLGLVEDHLSLDPCHGEVVLLLLNHLLEVDALDLQVGLSLDHLLPLLRHLLLHPHLLLLSRDEEVHLQLLDLLEVLLDSIRDLRFGDSDGKNLDAWRPRAKVLVEGLDEFLVELVEDVDVDLLQGVLGAELVDLVVQLVSDPELLIILSVVEHSVVDELLLQLVHHLDLVEVNQRSVGRSAGDAGDHVGLDAHLHLDEFLVHRNAEVESGLAERRLQHAQPLVDAHVTLLHLVETAEQGQHVGQHQCQNQRNNAHILSIWII
jgi:hypothetical protein